MWLCDLLGHMLSYLEPFTHMGMGLLGFQRGGLCMRKSTIYVLVKCLCVESIVVLVSGKWSGVVLVAQCSRHLCLSNLFCKVWRPNWWKLCYVYWTEFINWFLVSATWLLFVCHVASVDYESCHPIVKCRREASYWVHCAEFKIALFELYLPCAQQSPNHWISFLVKLCLDCVRQKSHAS